MTAILFNYGQYNGCPAVLLKCSKGNYYLWNLISSIVFIVLEPKTEAEIIRMLEDPYLYDIKTKELETVDSDSELEVLPTVVN